MSYRRFVKRGCGSGLTFGLFNEVKSVVRKVYNSSTPPQATEWCVIGKPGSDSPFSRAGDSGACVWDPVTGNVAGMITAGLRKDEALQSGHLEPGFAADLTYVTPLEWILEDIKECGLHLDVL